jgi:hypothetical protein
MKKTIFNLLVAFFVMVFIVAVSINLSLYFKPMVGDCFVDTNNSYAIKIIEDTGDSFVYKVLHTPPDSGPNVVINKKLLNSQNGFVAIRCTLAKSVNPNW